MGRGLIRTLAAVTAACWILGLPSLCLAAEEGNPNIFGPAIDLGIWTLVVFILLLLILGRYAWGPMLQGLQRREQNIHNAIAEAQKAREEAQVLQAQWQKSMDAAQEKVREIHEEARRSASKLADDITAKARADIQTERERLHREIAMARDQALQELWNRTAQLATMVSAKAIKRQLTQEDHRRLVDEALSELGHADQHVGAGARG
jgi:F-type H+-transporting ATPase subunit b